VKYILDPMLWISPGGIAIDVHYVARAYTYQIFGRVPKTLKSLAMDFGTNPPKAPSIEFSDEISADVWPEVDFRPYERALLSFDGNQSVLADRMAAKDQAVAHLAGMISPDILREYSGAEGAQLPAIVRTAMAYMATGPSSWFALLKKALQSLAEGASVFDASGEAPIDGGPSGRGLRVVIIVGGQGGTGTGALIPLGIVVRWLARTLGIHITIDVFVLAGKYREPDGQEDRKAALNRVMDTDLEFVMYPGNAILTMPLGPTTTARTEGRLFDTVLRQEAWGAFEHNSRAVIARAARTLTFRYFSNAGFQIQNSRGNVESRARLLTLADRPGWPRKDSGNNRDI
jgi:hypothetical protein